MKLGMLRAITTPDSLINITIPSLTAMQVRRYEFESGAALKLRSDKSEVSGAYNGMGSRGSLKCPGGVQGAAPLEALGFYGIPNV